MRCKEQCFGSCYYGVGTTPFYTGSGVEYDIYHDGRSEHLCANPLKVKETIETAKDPKIIGLSNPNGIPKLVYSVDLNDFTREEPRDCKTCPFYLENPGYRFPQPEFKPVIEELGKINPKCEEIYA